MDEDRQNRRARCPLCLHPLPTDAAEGLCPSCLFRAGLEPIGEADAPVGTGTYVLGEAHGRPNDVPRFAPGQPFGPYRIERLLGRGGMGEVYEVEHLEQGRRIALKVLNRRLNDEADRLRFLREGQLAAAVSHPHTVYVYGSDEIDKTPVIGLELLPGRTLKDRVEYEGPLAEPDAVDTILQVVSGLDAACQAGILHRDVKPSNCFVDTDGTVKVGDFGLSILTQDMPLPAAGAVHATPGFASPEQLRGHPLDVRSDIYAVGATLYHLLTGQPPFSDRNVRALISRSVTEAPRSPREIRPDIRPALAAVVLRCLSTERALRPASYGELRDALEPFGSTGMPPAPLGMRFAAGALDCTLSALVPLLVALLFLPPASTIFSMGPVMASLTLVAYFAVTESVWGTSLGKRLCDLRVVTDTGSRPPFGRALVRATMFVVPPWVLAGLALKVTRLSYAEPSGEMTATAVGFTVVGLLFVTARRISGLAGLHERVSHTRTVANVSVHATRAMGSDAGPPEDLAGPLIGPYRLVEPHRPSPSSTVVVGYDERLRRRVWLCLSRAESDPVPYSRRIVRRRARPCWLAGQRTTDLAWDAYEWIPGRPFRAVVKERHSWASVQEWLADLSEEIDAALRDGSLSDLDVDRVWIGNDGRARLLDWSAPDGHKESHSRPRSGAQTSDLAEAHRFLNRVAMMALEEAAGGTPLPVRAGRWLATLREQRFSTAKEMSAALVASKRGPAAISRTKRAVHLSFCAIPTILLLVQGLTFVYLQKFVVPGQDATRPDIAEFIVCLDRLAVLERRGEAHTNPEGRALEVYVAARYRYLISDPKTWSSTAIAQRQFTLQRRAIADRVLATWPAPQRAELLAAEGIVKPYLNRVTTGVVRRRSWSVIGRFFWLNALAGLTIASALGLASGLLGRGGFALRLMNIATVTGPGVLASGTRAGARAVLSWLPILLCVAATFAGPSPLLTLTPQPSPSFALRVVPGAPLVYVPNDASIGSVVMTREATIAVALTVFVVAVIAAAVRPERGVQDRLAGTWLVPM